MTKADLVQNRLDFLDYLLDIRGYSDLTVKSYDEALREALPRVEVADESGISVVDLMPYRLMIASQKPRTIAKKLSAWRSYIAYLKKQGQAVELRADESIKVPKTLPKPVSHSHIMEALAVAEPEERLVVVLLYTLGLRLSELHGLSLDQIGREWVRIRGKGDKVRDVPLPPAASEAIAAHRQTCAPRTFLCECNGRRLSENSLRYLVNRAFARVGLKVTPHQLRHAYATELLNHDARIADVSELLGHASMATTQIYTKLGSALKMKHYRIAHPLCKETDGIG
ncbi:tyrosine-type recombinase/integrase [Sulfurimonas diazotrophicus]|uniref:Tyrosine-type recombinase/integrase n=1 Tax=Sulfurimonas diazotrophicus TaxID=3131939 RepID=A0ABZ3HBA8_9BACT